MRKEGTMRTEKMRNYLVKKERNLKEEEEKRSNGKR